MRRRLLEIYDGIESRTHATNRAHAFWPCKRGCDGCCRSLAEIPRISRAEWDVLREGLDLLSAEARAIVDAKMATMATLAERPIEGGKVVCPMLDEDEGACLVYAHRPAACRTYGYYVRRGDGLHCGLVAEAVNAHEAHDGEPITWGNQESVEEALVRLSGEARSLIEWLGRRP